MPAQLPPSAPLDPVSPHWGSAFPWLTHGISTRGAADEGFPFDLGMAGRGRVGEVLGRWSQLHAATGFPTLVHARQPHEATVRMHGPLAPGLHLAPDGDGHLTTEPGVLLTVTVADCVPVYLVSEAPRAVALLHAGWRGVAAGILEAGIAAFRDRLGVGASELHLLLGPSICGRCYGVGPEVFEALGLPNPGAPARLDLRAHLLERGGRAGVLPAHMESSQRCTCCDPHLFSHRGGDAERQIALLGIRLPK